MDCGRMNPRQSSISSPHNYPKVTELTHVDPEDQHDSFNSQRHIFEILFKMDECIRSPIASKRVIVNSPHNYPKVIELTHDDPEDQHDSFNPQRHIFEIPFPMDECIRSPIASKRVIVNSPYKYKKLLSSLMMINRINMTLTIYEGIQPRSP